MEARSEMLNGDITDFWMRSMKLGVVKDLSQSLEPDAAVRPCPHLV